MSKSYTIIVERKGKEKGVSGTLTELIQHFSYTLLCGYEYNKKVNKKPKSIKTLVSNLNKATNAATVNGYSDTCYSL